MTTLTQSMNNSSTAGLVGQPAYRRFLSDLVRDVIPAPLLRYPALARLDADRRRLVQALKDVDASSGPPQMSEQQYIQERTKALREGTDLPEPPPPQAERDGRAQQRRSDVQAASDALLALGDDICQAVRENPAWADEGRAHIADLRERAAEMRRQADAAEREADDAGVLVLWLDRVARDELFVANLPSQGT
jgi:hypothetical protein